MFLAGLWSLGRFVFVVWLIWYIFGLFQQVARQTVRGKFVFEETKQPELIRDSSRGRVTYRRPS